MTTRLYQNMLCLWGRDAVPVMDEPMLPIMYINSL